MSSSTAKCRKITILNVFTATLNLKCRQVTLYIWNCKRLSRKKIICNSWHASGQCGVEGLGEMRFCLFASWMQFEVVKLAADCIRGQQPRCPVYLQCCLHCIAIAPASVWVWAVRSPLSLSFLAHTTRSQIGRFRHTCISLLRCIWALRACVHLFCCYINCANFASGSLMVLIGFFADL
jgi:hypothetical protein